MKDFILNEDNLDQRFDNDKNSHTKKRKMFVEQIQHESLMMTNYEKVPDNNDSIIESDVGLEDYIEY